LRVSQLVAHIEPDGRVASLVFRPRRAIRAAPIFPDRAATVSLPTTRQNGVVEAGGAARIVIVPPRAGRAAAAGSGALIAVVDVGWHQVGDLWAVDAADHGRWLSHGHTRDRCERLFPALGEEFRDQRVKSSRTGPGLRR